MRVLCVAEKPSIARAIAQALGGGAVDSHVSSCKYIRNYRLTYQFAMWGPCEVTVTAVLGHLTNVRFDEPYNNWDGVSPRSLYSAPISVYVPPDMNTVQQNLKMLGRATDILYIWTDCDLEGEHIGGEVESVIRCANSRIDVYRAVFNNVEPAHLRQAAQNPGRLDRRMIEAVDARRELDLRTGVAMTRFQTLLFSRHFECLKGELVSYGSCQFPTMGFVVERYFRIKEHVPEKFWKIDLNVAKSSDKVFFRWERGRLFDHAVAAALYASMLENDTPTVIHTECKPTTQYRPLPLTTVKFQKSGSQFLRIPSKKLMEIAEDLYNQGFISYPRTETDKFSDDMNLRELVKRHQGHSEWGQYATSLINGKYAPPRAGKHDDKAHPPIHPVKAAERSAFKSAAHYNVYEFVVRHFLAVCSNNAFGDESTVVVKMGDERFVASGVIVKELNYLEIYKYASWKSKHLPEFSVGETVKVVSALLHEGKTVPPKLLTEPELIGLMDAHGIGTDATMADHIAKIQERQFVAKEGIYFKPTSLGVALAQSYDSIGLDESITKPKLRHETELAVKEIASGQKRKADILARLLNQYDKIHGLVEARKQELLRCSEIYLKV